MALSIAPIDNPFEPAVVRGRVVEWLEGDAAWETIDQLSTKYTGAPYAEVRAHASRGQRWLQPPDHPGGSTASEVDRVSAVQRG